MTQSEFLSTMTSHGAHMAPASSDAEITLANAALQRMRAAIIPGYMMDLYRTTGGIIMGSACIFGPTEIQNGIKFPVPSIIQINNEIAHIPNMRGYTVFGRNDLFWFAFDAFGVCFMLDNTTLKPLRKYTDPLRAMTECLAVGKF
ncbi:MAG: hypothetical protein K2L94_00825 [Alphaproteobacteria bacterium]|nr:hypothetical protein [Alphaproteobacteria bacterium]